MIRFLKSYTFELLMITIFGLFILMLTSGIPYILAFHEWALGWSEKAGPEVQNAFTIFLSIFVEGLPFILIGVFLSALIHQYVNEELIWKYVPRHPLVSIPVAACLGLFLPICECGIVPIARRLIQKGFPFYMAFTFLLAAPVVNPITIASTYLAFGDDWGMTFQRVGMAVLISMVMGLGFALFFRKRPILKENVTGSCCSSENCHHDHENQEDHHHKHLDKKPTGSLGHALYHAIFEFIDMGKYFVLGGLLAAGFHVFVGVSTIQNFTENEFLAVLVMMGLAFGLSICSSADAFVAASFRNVIGTAPILSFLVYGPMMDVKNILMMVGSFRLPVVGFFFAGTTLLTLMSIWLFLM